jgi:drug/metabolite transporter (DMT)-like permease
MSAFLVALAAILWATDAPFRLPAVQALDPVLIVLIEHTIGLAALGIWGLVKKRQDFLALRPSDWISAILVGGGGSALATVFFTASFRFINPSLTILLQKLQPLLVVLMAFVILKERPKPGFLRWALVALLAATVLSFPDFNFAFLKEGLSLHSKGVLYALAAAALWALATVGGKHLLRRNAPSAVNFWRYGFGFVTLATIMILSKSEFPVTTMTSMPVLRALLYMSFIPGLLSMIAYYAGLLRTPASTATLIELLYPVSAIAINTFALHAPLDPVQLFAGGILLAAILKISLLTSK